MRINIINKCIKVFVIIYNFLHFSESATQIKIGYRDIIA